MKRPGHRDAKLLRLTVLTMFLGATGGATVACTCASFGPKPCPSLEGQIIFVGTVIGTNNSSTEEDKAEFSDLQFRLRVDERIAGTVGSAVDVFTGRGGGDCGFPFEMDKSYLVFAYKDSEGHLATSICSNSRALEEGQNLLAQLRAQRDSKPVANLFGRLWQLQQPYESIADAAFDKPLANTRIFLRSENKSFEVLTGSRGDYAIFGVPPGKYRVAADLPAHLEIAQTILSSPPEPLEMPANACYEYDVEAMPTSKIRGRVLDPAGNPVKGPIEIYREGKFSELKEDPLWAWWEYPKDDGYFEFHHLAPGTYFLVFNKENEKQPSAPFPRTFYPGVGDVKSAVPIVLGAGEQFLNADIHVNGGWATRLITVQIIWNGGDPPEYVFLNLRATTGEEPFAKEISPGLYEVQIFRNAEYKVFAEKSCYASDNEGVRLASKLTTNIVNIRGDDDKHSAVTLNYSGRGCPEDP